MNKKFCNRGCDLTVTYSQLLAKQSKPSNKRSNKLSNKCLGQAYYLHTYYVAGDIIPFFTDYPFVTHMDRPAADGEPAAMSIEETFFIKYILKPQPLSTGKYLLTFKPGENFKVCKLVVTHIGQNFPCAQIRYHPFITYVITFRAQGDSSKFCILFWFILSFGLHKGERGQKIAIIAIFAYFWSFIVTQEGRGKRYLKMCLCNI